MHFKTKIYLNSKMTSYDFLFFHRLPDDDREISVFDYFVDESGEWDTWATR